MIVGVGIDLVECPRVERELACGEWLTSDGVFTAAEIQLCCAAARPSKLYAACFAAKEAALKALAIGIQDFACLRDIELAAAADAGYAIVLHGRAKREAEHLTVRQIRVSIAVAAEVVGAMVILES